MYDKSYYETNNYSNYSEREYRYHKLAKELESSLSSFNLISKNNSILDYGAAYGFLVSGFQQIGYFVNAYDISDHAKNVMKSKKINVLEELPKHDILICLDVLEHMEDVKIHDLFEKVKPKILIGRIPVKLNKEDDKFYLEVSNKDSTHINCKTKEEWNDILNCYFKNILRLNLYSIYDSDGVYSFVAIK